ncbi:hypothetical protein F0L68_31015 [Solihabitans fulvus]|uniref:Uncharacterized protein n=1 Tax=Solihabitans fulvus TaxID=1892852 RepID=A0A5B2WU34_9PSEU|nr:hypothetical protein [Solihabitans fulvus]KAA2254046.1 hypothetical protein F0L68_31015 [Solihabitans fulvus]
MTAQHTFRDLAHSAMHRIPGVPAHVEHPAGHQGTTHHGRARHHSVAHHHARNGRWNHSPARRPRVLAAWQRWIASVFGQEL